MPTYHLTLQRGRTPDADHRAVRADESAQPHKITVEAADISAALEHTMRAEAAAGYYSRVTAVEEGSPWLAAKFSDQDIHAALTQDSPDANQLHPTDYEDWVSPIDHNDDFASILTDVVGALRESGLAPGLDISVLRDEYGCPDYAMVEIRDDAAMQYRSNGSELRHLSANRGAEGWLAVIELARGILQLAEDLM